MRCSTVLIASITFLMQPQAAPTVTTPEIIKLPCLPTSQSGFMRSCSELVPKIAGPQGNIEVNFANKMKCLDEELDVDIFTPPKAGTPSANPSPVVQGQFSCKDYGSKPFDKYCNLEKNEFTKPNTPRGAMTDCGKPLEYHTGIIYAHGSVGTLESRYIQGAYVQALASCKARLVDEIKTQNQFLAMSCPTHAIADYQKALSSWALLVKSAGDVSMLKENEQVDKYCSENSNYTAMMKDPDKIKHQMAVCYLAAARTHLEAMVSYLANCELYMRWTKWWYLHVAEFKTISYNAIQKCDGIAQKAADQGGLQLGCCGCYGIKDIGCICGSSTCWTTPDADIYEKQFNLCYKQEFPKQMKDLMDKLIPDGNTGCVL